MNAPETSNDAAHAAFDLYPELRTMFDVFPKYRREILPSKYWEELNAKNLQQLADSRYENFKQTLARNYFTWIVNPFNKQMRFLMKEAGIRRSLRYLTRALFAPRYLSAVCPDRNVFAFRPFDDFDDVRDELENAGIVFLTPNQLELLPDKSVDLFLNISSLHAMCLDQIRYYVGEIERLTRKYFYFKQWQETTVPFENETICEQDYSVGRDRRLFNRQQCAVRHKFFEALYEFPETS